MDPLDYEPVRRTIVSLPQVAAWPDIAELFAPGTELPSKDYRIPLFVSKAVCGEPERALPGAAAIACLQMTIVLVDDLLDDDPRGAQKRIGIGAAANVASALEAAAFKWAHHSTTLTHDQRLQIGRMGRFDPERPETDKKSTGSDPADHRICLCTGIPSSHKIIRLLF